MEAVSGANDLVEALVLVGEVPEADAFLDQRLDEPALVQAEGLGCFADSDVLGPYSEGNGE